jgi:hypothetical protein
MFQAADESGEQLEHLKNGHREYPIRRERREALPVSTKRGCNNQWHRETGEKPEGHTCEANIWALEDRRKSSPASEGYTYEAAPTHLPR